MATEIRKSTKPRLFLKEHREAADISAGKMGARLGIARESVYRVERTPSLRAKWQASYADALGYDDPSVLWHLPAPKLPQISQEDAQKLVEHVTADVLRRLGSGQR